DEENNYEEEKEEEEKTKEEEKEKPKEEDNLNEKDFQKFQFAKIWNVNNKSLFDINEQDIVCADKEQINAIIKRWSVPVLQYGQIDACDDHIMDLQSIENEILNLFINGRRIIQINTRLFQYSDEYNIPNCLDIMKNNNPKLIENHLDEQLWDAFVASIKSPSERTRALQLLSETIVFLHQSAKSIKPLRIFFIYVFCLKITDKLTVLMENLSFEQVDYILFE
ncbi:hypothetical protein RFI_38830, partial [Reticulomyxa filosa]